MILKTIILLSSKRTGSSAFFKVFKNHPKVNCLLKNPEMDMIELNFWNSALKAIQGNSRNLKQVLKKINIQIKLPKKINKRFIFKLWNEILIDNGGIIFDKSPAYLDDIKILKLLKAYEDDGNKLYLLGLIRNPKDSITSQFELWDKKNNNRIKNKIKKREKKWLKYYSNLQSFKLIRKLEIFRYEDITKKKHYYFEKIFKICGLKYKLSYTDNIKKTSIGRFNLSIYSDIKKWKFSKDFKDHLLFYNYQNYEKSPNFNQKLLIYLSYFKRMIPIKLYLYLAEILNNFKYIFGLKVKKWR